METEPNLQGLITAPDIYVQPFFPGIAAEVTAAILFLFLASVISGTEMAFASYGSADKSKTDKKHPAQSNTIAHLLSHPESIFASLLISNILCKVAFIVCSVCILFQTLYTLVPVAVFLFLVIIFEILSVIIFSEVLPKMAALHNPSRYIAVTRPVIRPILFIFKPFGNLFSHWANAFSKKLAPSGAGMSVNDITNAIELAKDKHSEDEEILKGIIKFGSIDVRKILKPRIDITSIEITMTLSQVIQIVIESGYSRIPVYSGNFDNVKGILYVKDLLPFITEPDSFKWQTLIRAPYFIPDTKKVKELLTEFQTNKNHMAVIVDEYGGTLGIVTLEDILEEIVGEISDESDEDEKRYTQINKNTYIFDGKILLNDFCKIFQTESEIFDDIRGDAETLAGLILEIKGEIPEKNEEIKVPPFTFKIEAADSRRIKQIRVVIDENEKL